MVYKQSPHLLIIFIYVSGAQRCSSCSCNWLFLFGNIYYYSVFGWVCIGVWSFSIFLHMNSQDSCTAISYYFLYSSQTMDFFTSHGSLFFCLRAQALHFSKWFFPVLPFCSSSLSFYLFNFQVTFRKLSLFLPARSNNPSSDLIGHISCLSL